MAHKRGPYFEWLRDADCAVPRQTRRRYLQQARQNELQQDDEHQVNIVEPMENAAQNAGVGDVPDGDGGLPDDGGLPNEDGGLPDDRDYADVYANEQSSDSDEDASADELVPNNENEDMLHLDNNIDQYEFLHSPLHEQSPVTLGKFMYDTVLIYHKHKLSKSCLQDILKLNHSILPAQNLVPNSNYKFLKLIDTLVKYQGEYKRHYMCSNKECQHFFGEELLQICPVCNGTSNCTFIENDIGKAIKFLFEERSLATLMDEKKEQYNMGNKDFVSDVTDGACYEKIIRNRYDIVFISNTDGVPFSRSSQVQCWPIFCTIAEVPPKLRRKYMILAGIWIGTGKPNMNSYFKPFVQSMATLSNQGVVWKDPNSAIEYTSKIFAPLWTVDAQARAPLQNLSLFNAEHGCSSCEQKGERVVKGNGTAQVYPSEDIEPKQRTHERMMEQCGTALETGTPCMGIKGPTVLALLVFLDWALSFVPDPMHSGFLGAIRQLLYLWFSSSNHRADFYIGNKISEIDERLSKYKVPEFIKRPPRSLKELKYWKASELRNWLIFYCLPSLSGILPKKYFEHLMLLVQATYILSKEKIFFSEIKYAESLLKIFAHELPSLYGKENCTFNMHQLLHWGKTTRNWGPIWAWSAFVFEAENGTIKAICHGTSNIEIEIYNSMSIINSLYFLKNYTDLQINDNLCNVLGAPVKLNELEQNLREAISQHDALGPNSSIYLRICCRGFIYSSNLYLRSQKRCNSYAKYRSDTGIEHIVCFAAFSKSPNNVFCFGYDVITRNSEFKHSRAKFSIDHIQPFALNKEAIKVFSADQIVCPVVNLADTHLCTPPNLMEINM